MGAALVFGVASFLQAVFGDSSMFDESYARNGLISDLIINITFYPGWVITVGLSFMGIVALFGNKTKR